MKVFKLPGPSGGGRFDLETEPKSGWKTPGSEVFSRLRSSGRWKKVRELVLSRTPLCCFCGRPANEVHHIDHGDLNRFFDWDNLAPICQPCHAKVNAAYKRGIDPQMLFPKKEKKE